MKVSRICSLPLVGFLISGTLMLSCEKKDDKDDASTTAEVTGGIPGVSKSGAVNALADAFPVSLALSAFPQASSGAALTATLEEEVVDPNANKNLKEKVAANKEIVEGRADRCLDANVFRPHRQPSAVTCYEFDSDMNPMRLPAQGDRTRPDFGTIDGTDGSGEACLVSFVRSEVQEAVETVDQALALIGGMICQAKKDGSAVAMPATGSSIDLTTSLGNATNGHLVVDSAQIARLDDIDARAVYRSDIKVTNEREQTLEVHLVHSPGDGDNGNGTLWFIRSGGKAAAGGPAVDPNNSDAKNFVMSITYSRSEVDGVPKMRFESSRAAIVNSISPVDASGQINFAEIPKEAGNDVIHAINFVAFDGNTETNEGTLSYWQNPGGSYQESARGFLFNTVADPETGTLAGCGVSGATGSISIRKAILEPSEDNTLKPVRYWHPQGSQNIHPDKDSRYVGNEGFAITQQCFKQGSDGIYAIDSEKTVDARGYDVLATEEIDVAPPTRPEHKLDGDFAQKIGE